MSVALSLKRSLTHLITNGNWSRQFQIRQKDARRRTNNSRNMGSKQSRSKLHQSVFEKIFFETERKSPQKFPFHLCHSEKRKQSPFADLRNAPSTFDKWVKNLLPHSFDLSAKFPCNFLTGSDKCKIGEANRRYSQRETKGPFLHNSCPISAHDISWQ